MPTIIGAGDPTSGYNISNSLRFNNPDDPHLTTGNFSSASNRRTFTISVWVKRGQIVDDRTIIGYGSANNPRGLFFFGGNTLRFTDNVAGNATKEVESSALFRDPSAWYHVMAVIDTTQGTASNRFKIYANGQLLDIASSTYPDQNYETGYGNDGNGNGLFIGRYGNGANDDYHFDGYMADFNYVDGLALDPSYFGETDDNGVWIPKEPDVSDYGTNGFFLEFKQTGTSQNSSGMGADTSGKDNHLAVTNLAATDVTTDTPTNNFCTMNPLAKGVDATLAEGNCQIAYDNNDRSTSTANMGIANGKWYWEFKITADGNAAPCSAMFGIGELPYGPDLGTYLGQNASGWGYAGEDGKVYNSGNNPSYGNTFGINDIIGVAFDADNGNLYFYKNGTIQNSGTAAATGLTSSSTGFYYPAVGDSSGVQTFTAQANFGNPPYAISSGNTDGLYGNFEYAPPSGYYALCTKNLAKYG